MTVDIARSSLIPSVACQSTTPAPAQLRSGLLARCGAWLRRLNDACTIQGIEPRLARETGAVLLQDVLAAVGALGGVVRNRVTRRAGLALPR